MPTIILSGKHKGRIEIGNGVLIAMNNGVEIPFEPGPFTKHKMSFGPFLMKKIQYQPGITFHMCLRVASHGSMIVKAHDRYMPMGKAYPETIVSLPHPDYVQVLEYRDTTHNFAGIIARNSITRKGGVLIIQLI